MVPKAGLEPVDVLLKSTSYDGHGKELAKSNSRLHARRLYAVAVQAVVVLSIHQRSGPFFTVTRQAEKHTDSSSAYNL